MSRPAVSIVTPMFNAGELILQAGEAVHRQTLSDWEWIIVDDNSTDHCSMLARGLAGDDRRIVYLQNPTRSMGPGGARNVGINASQGRWVAFLDADDLWDPVKLEWQTRFMVDHRSGLSYTGYVRRDSAGNALSAVRPPTRITYGELLKRNVIACSTAMYDSEIVGRPLMSTLPQGQDYATWLRLVRQLGHAEGIADPLATYLVRPGSVSSNKRKSALWTWRLYRAELGLPMPASVASFGNYALHGAFRSLKELAGRSDG